MDDKELKVIKILAELGLRNEACLTAEQEQLWLQATDPDEQFLADIKKFVGEEVIDITRRLQTKRAAELDAEKQELEVDIPLAFTRQKDRQDEVKQAIYRIEDKGACSKASFKYPTLFRNKNRVNAVKSIFLAFTDRTDPNHRFARQVVDQRRDELVAAIDTDMAAFEKLKVLITKDIPMPQHIERDINGAIHDYRVMRNYFMRGAQ